MTKQHRNIDLAVGVIVFKINVISPVQKIGVKDHTAVLPVRHHDTGGVIVLEELSYGVLLASGVDSFVTSRSLL